MHGCYSLRFCYWSEEHNIHYSFSNCPSQVCPQPACQPIKDLCGGFSPSVGGEGEGGVNQKVILEEYKSISYLKIYLH